MDNTIKYTEPLVITWADVLVQYEPGEFRHYDTEKANGIRNAISRRLKFTHPQLTFETWFEQIGGVQKICVRRTQ